MKYVNANDILPDMLIEELQKYVQAGYIYIPVKNEQHKSWGELSVISAHNILQTTASHQNIK